MKINYNDLIFFLNKNISGKISNSVPLLALKINLNAPPMMA
jgi:hypothetical protein